MDMGVELTLLVCTFILTVTMVALTIIRAIIDWKLFRGSQKYWDSWKKRRKDVARDVLNSVSTRQLKRELKKRKP